MFYTRQMDGFLPLLSESQRNWGDETYRAYCYWFEKANNKLVIHFELGYKNGARNLSDELKRKSDALIIAADKTLNYNYYKRLYRKTRTLSEDNYESSMKNAVRILVKSALENEEKLLAKVAEQEEQ